MDAMGERVKKIRTHKDVNLTLEKFGERLGVKKSAISRIENGTNNITDQMFMSICREFNVNPTYLRDGTGEMFIEMDQDGIIASWVGSVLKDSPESFQKKVVAFISGWKPEDWKWVEQKTTEFIEIMTKSQE